MNFPTPPETAAPSNETEMQNEGQNTDNIEENNNNIPANMINSTTANRVVQLRHVLETNLKGCDVQWALFVAAVMSYRYQEKLKPVPPWYASEQLGIDIDEIIDVINDTPQLDAFLQLLQSEEYDEISEDSFQLVHWVLCNLNRRLRVLSAKEAKLLLCNLNYPEEQLPQPSMIFELIVSSANFTDEIFINQSAHFPITWSYYGNKLDSYYSILNKGFHCEIHETGQTMLTLKAEQALQRSPLNAAWGGALCGSMLSCLLACECLQQPDDVFVSSEGDWIAVANGNYVRARYLLLYDEATLGGDDAGSDVDEAQCSAMRHAISGFLNRHKSGLYYTGYISFLAFVLYYRHAVGNNWRMVARSQLKTGWGWCKEFLVQRVYAKFC